MTILFGGFVLKPATSNAITNFTVEVSPKITGTIAEYKFQFSLEKELQVHQYIEFVFPKGTVLTPPLPEDHEKRIKRLAEMINAINFCQIGQSSYPENPCAGLPYITFQKDGTISLKINTWINLDPTKESYRDICITVYKEAGFTNPLLPGVYTYKIRTQAEDKPYVESQSVEITKKPELPDTINANLWFSNLVEYEVTNMLIHIPLEVTDLCCFELKLDIPSDILDMTAYFSQEILKKEEPFDFIKEHVFINGKSLKESKTGVALIGLSPAGTRFYFQAVPSDKNIKELNILFDKALRIKFLKDGLLHVPFSTIFVKADGVKEAKEIKLLFPDNYIFPEG